MSSGDKREWTASGDEERGVEKKKQRCEGESAGASEPRGPLLIVQDEPIDVDLPPEDAHDSTVYINESSTDSSAGSVNDEEIFCDYIGRPSNRERDRNRAGSEGWADKSWTWNQTTKTRTTAANEQGRRRKNKARSFLSENRHPVGEILFDSIGFHCQDLELGLEECQGSVLKVLQDNGDTDNHEQDRNDSTEVEECKWKSHTFLLAEDVEMILENIAKAEAGRAALNSELKTLLPAGKKKGCLNKRNLREYKQLQYKDIKLKTTLKRLRRKQQNQQKTIHSNAMNIIVQLQNDPEEFVTASRCDLKKREEQLTDIYTEAAAAEISAQLAGLASEIFEVELKNIRNRENKKRKRKLKALLKQENQLKEKLVQIRSRQERHLQQTGEGDGNVDPFSVLSQVSKTMGLWRRNMARRKKMAERWRQLHVEKAPTLTTASQTAGAEDESIVITDDDLDAAVMISVKDKDETAILSDEETGLVSMSQQKEKAVKQIDRCVNDCKLWREVMMTEDFKDETIVISDEETGPVTGKERESVVKQIDRCVSGDDIMAEVNQSYFLVSALARVVLLRQRSVKPPGNPSSSGMELKPSSSADVGPISTGDFEPNSSGEIETNLSSNYKPKSYGDVGLNSSRDAVPNSTNDSAGDFEPTSSGDVGPNSASDFEPKSSGGIGRKPSGDTGQQYSGHYNCGLPSSRSLHGNRSVSGWAWEKNKSVACYRLIRQVAASLKLTPQHAVQRRRKLGEFAVANWQHFCSQDHLRPRQ